MSTKGAPRAAAKQSAVNTPPAACCKPLAQASIETPEELITDSETIESIERGLADLKAGRVKPWNQVKRDV